MFRRFSSLTNGIGFALYPNMVWFFERDDEVVACEVRREPEGFEVAYQQGSQRRSRVVQAPEELFAELENAAAALVRDGWIPCDVDLLTGAPIRRNQAARREVVTS